MKHQSVRDLHSYWDACRGDAAVPERDSIEPGPIRRILADTFILNAEPRHGYPFRLAGTRVCAIFAREMKDDSFVRLWDMPARPMIQDLLMVVTGEGIGVVAGVSATSESGAVDLELLLLPIALHGRRDLRLMGALVVPRPPYWLGRDSAQNLTLGSIRYLDDGKAAEADPALTVEAPEASLAPGGRVRRGLIVYDGGRTGPLQSE